MALDTFAPEYFSQEFTPAEFIAMPYLRFARNISGMVPAGGNQVTWPDVEGSVTVQNYTKYTDLSDRQGDDTQYTLTVNQQKATDMVLDSLDRVQRMPSVMAQYVVQSDRQLMLEVHNHLRTTFEAATRLGASITGPIRGNPAATIKNQDTLTLLTEDGTGTAHAKINSADGRAEIIRAMDQMAGDFAKRRGWVAPDADTKGVVVVPLEVHQQINEYLWNDKPNLGAGSIVDSSFGLGKVTKVVGWEIVEDPDLAPIDLNDGNAVLNLNFMHPEGQGLFYAQQLTEMRTEQVQKQFGQRMLALYLYGATQGAARHLYQLKVNLDDT